MEYSFNKMLNDLKIGREIEFDYKGQHYSIVNGNGKWFFCEDKQSVELCNFEEVNILLDKIKKLILQNEPIENVIDRKLYTQDTLYIL
ncbi:hypothetical protein [Clostridium minihomine]|uniref:hypothetical protein n=1 Tax=Clostridium minihomine TaxID=2045012 RepID=UPI000C7954D6|nr:hypothetical protein [Clostridium minihomine]